MKRAFFKVVLMAMLSAAALLHADDESVGKLRIAMMGSDGALGTSEAQAANRKGIAARDGAMDNESSANFFKVGAEGGNAEAQLNLASCYESGKGVGGKDLQKMVIWGTMAAVGGNATAMFRLGGYYANGHGVKKDPAEAREWYKKSADAGHMMGRRMVQILEEEAGKKVVKASASTSTVKPRATEVKPDPYAAMNEKYRLLPEKAKNLMRKADNAFNEKENEEATKLYKEFLDIAPEYPYGWYNLAVVYSRVGNYEMAIADMRRYLEVFPDAPDAQIVRNTISDWHQKWYQIEEAEEEMPVNTGTLQK